nr:hypothetical protein [Candidatus Microthrix sp.]
MNPHIRKRSNGVGRLRADGVLHGKGAHHLAVRDDVKHRRAPLAPLLGGLGQRFGHLDAPVLEQRRAADRRLDPIDRGGHAPAARLCLPRPKRGPARR